MSSEKQEIVKPVKIFFSCISPKEESSNLPPIILQAGLMSTNSTFNGIKYQLCRNTKRKVYSLNLRNHGSSEWSHDFTLEHLIADLKYFMDLENIPKAILVGHSLGGRATMGFALRYPEMVEKLVVEDMTLTTKEENRREVKKSFVFARMLWRSTNQLPTNISDKEAHSRLLPLAQTVFPKANYAVKFPIHKDKTGKFVWDINMDVLLDLENKLELLEMDLSHNPQFIEKTLMLAGDMSDIRVQDEMEEVRKSFPNARCEIIENGYHAYHLEQPKQYIHLVSTFINE